MALRTISVFECDVHNDQTKATTQRSFAVQGQEFLIDVCEADAARFDAAMEEWVTNARQVGGRRKAPVDLTAETSESATTSKRSRGDSDAAAIREWAKGRKGMKVSPRGVISQNVRDAYYADKNKSA